MCSHDFLAIDKHKHHFIIMPYLLSLSLFAIGHVTVILAVKNHAPQPNLCYQSSLAAEAHV